MSDITVTKRPHSGSSDSPDDSREESTHTQPEKHAKVVVDRRKRVDGGVASKPSGGLMKKAAAGVSMADQLEEKRGRVKTLQAEFESLSQQLRELVPRQSPHVGHPRASVSSERRSAATLTHDKSLPPECDEPWGPAEEPFDAFSAARRITDEHIKLLKTYNELKDTAKDLAGMIASQRDMTLAQVMEEMGVEMSDK
ncbi:unnamed protein product [[Candida] boidinii]|uniref:Unnamed protein product n=1 Tax=Candida boidinii TaxID=5477 RepID=A0A9W6SVU9_CANBO|nr:unnamed protein product [[Candida] boidinii]GMF50020.1 unnamed protein product [[Candida] boidinii]GMF98440.1 unnamed protein product [[Candida] boidinii]